MLQTIAQLVLGIGNRKIGRGVAPRAALDRHHVEAFVRQFVGENGAGPAEPDNGHVFTGELLRHRRCSLQTICTHKDQFGWLAMPTGGKVTRSL